MRGLNYFRDLGCDTWGDVADLHEVDLFDLVGDTDEVYAEDYLFDCIMLDDLASMYKQYLYEQTHFTEGISI